MVSTARGPSLRSWRSPCTSPPWLSSSYVAGAELLAALGDGQVAIGVLQTLGIVAISILMLRGVFARSLAWLGVVTGVIGLASEALRPLLGAAYALYGVLVLIWLIWVARTLWGLGVTSGRAGSGSSRCRLLRGRPLWLE